MISIKKLVYFDFGNHILVATSGSYLSLHQNFTCNQISVQKMFNFNFWWRIRVTRANRFKIPAEKNTKINSRQIEHWTHFNAIYSEMSIAEGRIVLVVLMGSNKYFKWNMISCACPTECLFSMTNFYVDVLQTNGNFKFTFRSTFTRRSLNPERSSRSYDKGSWPT